MAHTHLSEQHSFDPIAELEKHLLRAGSDPIRLQAYHRFLPEIVTSHPREAVRIIEKGSRIAISLDNWEAHGELLRLRADAYLLLRDPSSALEDLHEIHARAEESGDAALAARISISIGEAYMMLGDSVTACGWHQKAIEQCGKGATAIHADALEALANLYLSIGRHDESIGLLQESRAIREELDDQCGIGRALCAIGTVYGRMGELTMAYDYHQHSLHLFQEAGEIAYAARALANMAGIHSSRGELNDAIEIAWRAHAACEVHGDWSALAHITITIADMHLQQGERDLAREYYIKAYDLLQKHPADDLLLGLYQRLGGIHETQEDLDSAAHVYRHALMVADNIGERQLQLELHQAISRVYERQAKYREALWHYQQFATIQQELAGEEQRRKSAEAEMRYNLLKIERERDATKKQVMQLEANHAQTERELTETTIDLTAATMQLEKLKAASKGKTGSNESIRHELQKQSLKRGRPSRTSASAAEQEWEKLRCQLEKIHPDFENDLIHLCPQLTQTEVKLCSLTKLLGNNTGRIAEVLDNTMRTVQTQRQRIRKKLGLAKDVNFASYIKTL